MERLSAQKIQFVLDLAGRPPRTTGSDSMSKIYQMSDQLAFAELSGDFNPLHVDAISARRTQFGRPLVHGIHLLLWTLEAHWKTPGPIKALRVTFPTPVGVQEPVSCAGVNDELATSEFVLQARGGKALTAIVSTSEASASAAVLATKPSHQPCVVREAEALENASGALVSYFDAKRAAALFPRLTKSVPAHQLAVILASTRLVGMECPGLHSIFSELNLAFFAASPAAGPEIAWQTTEFDRRFNRVTIALTAGGTKGTILAFLRPVPQAQPSTRDLIRRVNRREFADRRALVIGGSRGIGELCAKLLGAGGADVRLTYHRGADDAAKIVQDICSAGGRAQAFVLDVLAPEQLTEAMVAGWVPTHVYYFPTPPIFVAARTKFSSALLSQFLAYYVTGFHKIYETLRTVSAAPITFSYPSSAAVDDVPANMGEYAAAKAAGEVLCRYLMNIDRKLRIKISRLPRLPTDQTATVQQISTGDPIEIMTALIRD